MSRILILFALLLALTVVPIAYGDENTGPSAQAGPSIQGAGPGGFRPLPPPAPQFQTGQPSQNVPYQTTQPWPGQGTASGSQQMPMGQMSMGGMGCGGMGSMGSMGNMQMGQSGMSHNMEQGFSMREILYILSMQDMLQVMNDMMRIQEKLLAQTPSREKAALRKDIEQNKEKLKKLSADYRGMISGQIRND